MCPADADEPGEAGDEPAGPRPDPLDRPWVHPTELHSFVPTPQSPASPPRPREWVIGLTSAVAGVVATILVLVAFGAIGSRNRSPIRPPVVSAPDEVLDYAVAARVFESAAPSIVMVQVKAGDATTVQSGVAVRSDRVLTSAHQLGGAAAVTVVTHDGRAITAKVLGADPDTDLTLLDVPGGDLPFATLATGSEPAVGQAVVAIGAGKTGQGWLGMNVVAERNSLVLTGTGGSLAGLIQTGISAPPDATGGALLDTSGHVVGILTTVPGAPKTGLAVPIAAARDVQNQLDASGKVVHGWLGVVGDDESDRVDGGAHVTTVVEGSPAAKAGLIPGDVVTRVGTLPIHSYGDLVAEWRRRRPGDPFTITFWRGNQAHNNVAVTLAAPPEAPTAGG
jgi:putative serine protease PepD